MNDPVQEPAADFPAAHSMDLHWFAVDCDGHVAQFDSGEAGAVPLAAFQSRSDALPVLFFRELPRCDVVHDAEGFRRSGLAPEDSLNHLGHNSYTLLFLPSADPVREYVERGSAILAPAREGVAVYLTDAGIPEAFVEQLHDQGLCQGCFWHWRMGEDEPNAAEYGFYLFRHPMFNAAALAYGRILVPTRPLHVDQLPARHRAQFKKFTFPELSFAETPHIQPVEHADCAAWGLSYETLAGDEKAMPGREREWEEYMAQLEAEFGDEEPNEGLDAEDAEE
jgi:hypothetical protein